MAKFWILQKKIKNRGKKLTYLFYVMSGNLIISRIGYLMIIMNNCCLIRINFTKLFHYLQLYRGLLEIRSDIYLKFFFLLYFLYKYKKQVILKSRRDIV